MGTVVMNPEATLTKREYEIGSHLAWGDSKKEIANKLYISVRTVENTARNIYEKIEVNNVAQLTAWMFCKKFKASMFLNPLLSLIFIFLIGVNEINDDDTAIRTRTSGRVKTTRVVKNKHKVKNNLC